MPEVSPSLSETELNTLYSVLRSRLHDLAVRKIERVAGAAGFDLTRIPTGSSDRNQLLPAIDGLFAELAPQAKLDRLRLLADEIGRSDAGVGADAQELLLRHGYQFLSGQFVPIGLLDAREAVFLPPTAASELAKAAARLVDGDWTGAITSACGAVDLTTQGVYASEGLGDPGQASFQTKVNTALKQLRTFEVMTQQFTELGMSPPDAADVVKNVHEATKRSAEALQVLRRAMGDTHGSKPAMKSTAYDAVKWASAICALFEVR